MGVVMYSAQLEKSIINSIIQGGLDAMQDAVCILKREAEHFYQPMPQECYKILCHMFDNNQHINKLTFFETALKNGMDREAAAKFLSSISRMESQPIVESCHLLVEYSSKRTLDKVLADLTAAVHTESNSSIDILAQMQATVEQVTASHIVDNLSDLQSIAEAALARVNEAMENKRKGKLAGVGSGFVSLDNALGGFKPGELIVIAARPGMGKTSFALSYALNAATNKEPVAVFSLEMDKESLVTRMASQMSGIGLFKILNGLMTHDELQSFRAHLDILSQMSIFIDDGFNLNLTTLRAQIMKLIRTHGIKAVFIDYLQLMRMPKAANREREVSETTRALKSMAKEFKIPIVILSQLNRMSENRNDNRPVPSDLRESGAIEQDADVILLLHRPEVYGVKQYPDGGSTDSVCEVIIGKQRNGAMGVIPLGYIKTLTKFCNIEELEVFTPEPPLYLGDVDNDEPPF